MVAFYNEGDQEIYDKGEHFIPQQQYRLNKFNNTVAPMPMDGTQQVTQNFGIPYTGAFTNAGGGGGGGGLGGRFGNLDLSKTKTFNKNVYQGPITGWEMQDITGYYDPTSNTYKTYEGKNIKHAGLFTGDPQKGDIEGEDFQFPGITGAIAQWLKNKKDQIGGAFTGGKASQADIDAANKDALGSIVKHNIQTYGNQDRPNTGINEPGAEKGQSPTGGDVEGTPFAQGGRIGYKKGGRQDQMGGTMEQTAQELREAAPDQFAGGMNISHGGGDGNNQSNTGGITQLVDTDLISTTPSMEAMYSPSELATLRARLYNKNLLTEDDINLEGDVTGGIGPIDYGINFTGEGVTGSNVGMGPVNVDIGPNKELRNISLNQDIGNWNVQGNTDLENYGLGVNYNPDDSPFFAGASMDNMGNKNFNVGAKWSWGQPEQTYSTQALLDQNPDLVYGLKYGGLVGLL